MLNSEVTAEGVVGTVYASETSMRALANSMSDTHAEAEQTHGWLQETPTTRVLVWWQAISHTAYAWRHSNP